MNERKRIALEGCTPEPLMSYLKALGVFRLVSEQADRDATACWENDVFTLYTCLDRDALVKFFLEAYKPTPIVVPWSGGDFIGVDIEGSNRVFKNTPTGSTIIEAFLCTSGERLDNYRKVLQEALKALKLAGISKKTDMEKKDNKVRYLSILRSRVLEDTVLWIDSAAVIAEQSTPFSAMLGSGGGSDGNTHFSDNFMQNLWDVLPDFDSQREQRKGQQLGDTASISKELLFDALFDLPTNQLVVNRTSALYDSGAVGGPNATQGMERKSLANPWNIIFLFEGVLGFAGALVKRIGVNAVAAASFPFQFRYTTASDTNSADKESSGRELWMPIWLHQSTWEELTYFLGEGRAEVGRKSAQNGLDMARAVASLSVDRGIDSFYRYSIVKGRVGGDNYMTAASQGRFPVRYQRNVELLQEPNFDNWLDRFRSACSGNNVPARFTSALRRIESAIFDYCRYGEQSEMANVLIALGAAERELAVTRGKVGQSKMIPWPLSGLDQRWIEATNDGSPEYRIALALAGVRDPSQTKENLGPLRCNMEPVEAKGWNLNWLANPSPQVVWSSSDLMRNLAAVLERRLMDGARAGCKELPIEGRIPLSLNDVANFQYESVDDARIEALLWGLIAVKPAWPKQRSPDVFTLPLPRVYALLKLLFLPRPLVSDPDESGKRVWKLSKDGKEGLRIRPEPRILSLLRAGRVGEACEIAYRRLLASGIPPMPGPTSSGVWRGSAWEDAFCDPQRLAAALLLPIDDNAVNQLVRIVTRFDEIEEDQPEGE